MYNADTSDPNGLDGPPGPGNGDGRACERYDYANNPGTNPGLLGGGEDDGAADDGSDDGAADDSSDDGAADDSSDDGAADDVSDDTASGEDDSDDAGEASELPNTGTGMASNGSDSMLLVTVLSGVATLLGVAALRVRDQS